MEAKMGSRLASLSRKWRPFLARNMPELGAVGGAASSVREAEPVVAEARNKLGWKS